MATCSAQTQRQAHLQDILDRQTKSGLSAAAFCKSAGIAPQTFYWWRARLRGGTPPGARTKGDTMAPFVDLGALRGAERILIDYLPSNPALRRWNLSVTPLPSPRATW